MRPKQDRRPIGERLRGRVRGMNGQFDVEGGADGAVLSRSATPTGIFRPKPDARSRRMFLRAMDRLGLDHEVCEYQPVLVRWESRSPVMVGKGKRARQLRGPDGQPCWHYVGAEWEDVPAAYRVYGPDPRQLVELARHPSVLDVSRELAVAIPRGDSPKPWSAGAGQLSERAKRELKVHPLHGPAVLPRPERQAIQFREWLKGQPVEVRDEFAVGQAGQLPPATEYGAGHVAANHAATERLLDQCDDAKAGIRVLFLLALWGR